MQLEILAFRVDRVLTALAQESVEALVVHPTVVLNIPHGRSRILEFAVQHRLPAIYTSTQPVEASGLMSYGAHFPDMWRRGLPVAEARRLRSDKQRALARVNARERVAMIARAMARFDLEALAATHSGKPFAHPYW